MQDLTVVLSSAADAVVVGKCKMEAETIRGSGFAAFNLNLFKCKMEAATIRRIWICCIQFKFI